MGFLVRTVEAETIALHPFQGEDMAMAEIFQSVLVMELYMAPGGYSVYAIDLNNIPPDVPPGGFPAHICPSPSLTQGVPYAITGEVLNDPNFPGSYRLRLYLWEMKNNNLLIFDELTAWDFESCEKQMRYLLAWLLSWIDRKEPAGTDRQTAGPGRTGEQLRIQEPLGMEEQVSAERPAMDCSTGVDTTGADSTYRAAESLPQYEEPWDPSRWLFIGGKNSGNENTTALDNPDQWVYLGPLPEKWLYLGLRGGMGSSQWYYDSNQAYSMRNQDITNFWNANLSLQVSVHILPFLDLQTECNFIADFTQLGDITTGVLKEDKMFTSWSLTIPILAKLSLRGSHLKAGIFGGFYFYIPLFQTNGDRLAGYFDYNPHFPGFTFGMSLGWKLGIGYIFLDGRLDFDGRWFNSDRDLFYYRNMARINVGYEIGFINKKAK